MQCVVSILYIFSFITVKDFARVLKPIDGKFCFEKHTRRLCLVCDSEFLTLGNRRILTATRKLDFGSYASSFDKV